MIYLVDIPNARSRTALFNPPVSHSQCLHINDFLFLFGNGSKSCIGNDTIYLYYVDQALQTLVAEYGCKKSVGSSLVGAEDANLGLRSVYLSICLSVVPVMPVRRSQEGSRRTHRQEWIQHPSPRLFLSRTLVGEKQTTNRIVRCVRVDLIGFPDTKNRSDTVGVTPFPQTGRTKCQRYTHHDT